MRTQIFLLTGILLLTLAILTACTASQLATPPLATAPATATDKQPLAPSPTLAVLSTAQIASPAAASNAAPSPTSTTPPAATLSAATQAAGNTTSTPIAASTTAAPRPTLAPDAWKKLPVIPAVSNSVLQIYQRGLELGNNPHAFSKIGDCGSTPAWFLGDFDRGAAFYNLGDYQGLQNVIQYYRGSYERTSLAAQSGFNASSLFVTLWADRSFCKANEAPLACEYRVHRPIIAFIMLGTNDVWHPEDFEPQMRKIIEFSLQQGVIPILSTKADNVEGDHYINTVIADLATEYDIPLWNFWSAVQKLPDGGLQEDRAHLTWGSNQFNDPAAMTKAWPIRNLNALQMLNAIWQKVNTATP